MYFVGNKIFQNDFFKNLHFSNFLISLCFFYMTARATTNPSRPTAMYGSNINEQAKLEAERFCRENNVSPTRKNIRYVKGRYFNCMRLNIALTPDHIIKYDLDNGTSTSDVSYDFDYLSIQDGILDIFWSPTKERLQNINLERFKSYQEFRACFKGKIKLEDENLLKQYWNEWFF